MGRLPFPRRGIVRRFVHPESGSLSLGSSPGNLGPSFRTASTKASPGDPGTEVFARAKAGALSSAQQSAW